MRLHTNERHEAKRARALETLEHAWHALESDRRLRFLRHHGYTLALDGGALTIEGEVEDIATKTRALTILRFSRSKVVT